MKSAGTPWSEYWPKVQWRRAIGLGILGKISRTTAPTEPDMKNPRILAAKVNGP